MIKITKRGDIILNSYYDTGYGVLKVFFFVINTYLTRDGNFYSVYYDFEVPAQTLIALVMRLVHRCQ